MERLERLGADRHGVAGEVRRVLVWRERLGKARHSVAGTARRGLTRNGAVWSVKAG